MSYKEIYYDWQICDLKPGNRVRFCINDVDELPPEARYVGRRGSDLVFEGQKRASEDEESRMIKFGVMITEVSASNGRLKIRERVTLRLYD